MILFVHLHVSEFRVGQEPLRRAVGKCGRAAVLVHGYLLPRATHTHLDLCQSTGRGGEPDDWRISRTCTVKEVSQRQTTTAFHSVPIKSDATLDTSPEDAINLHETLSQLDCSRNILGRASTST